MRSGCFNKAAQARLAQGVQHETPTSSRRRVILYHQRNATNTRRITIPQMMHFSFLSHEPSAAGEGSSNSRLIACAFLLKCQATPSIGRESSVGTRNSILGEYSPVWLTSTNPGLINGMSPDTSTDAPTMPATAATASKAVGFFMMSTSQITDPAPVASALEQRRHRRVRRIYLG